VPFRAADLSAAGRYLASLFGMGGPDTASVLLAADLYSPLHLVVLAVSAVLIFQPAQAHEWVRERLSGWRIALLVPLFAFSLATMFSQAFNPFLYFQF
jgi:hypothetical protein